MKLPSQKQLYYEHCNTQLFEKWVGTGSRKILFSLFEWIQAEDFWLQEGINTTMYSL